MGVTVHIPGSMKIWFDGQTQATCQAALLGRCLEELARRFPAFHQRLYDSEGQISSVILFVNGDNYMRLQGLETPLSDGDELAVLPLAAGG